MPPLTWQNVAAPNFSGANEALRLSAELANRGFGALDSALGDFQKNREQAASAQLMADVLKYQDAQSLGDALRSGSILDGRNVKNLSEESLRFLAGRRSDLLTEDFKRIGNDNAVIQGEGYRLDNAQASENLRSSRATNQLREAAIAARPQAMALVNQSRAMAAAGDLEGAQALLDQNIELLSRSGLDYGDVFGIRSGNENALTSGYELQDTINNRQARDEGRNLASELLAKSGTPGLAADAIRRSNAPDNVKLVALGEIESKAPALVGDGIGPDQLIARAQSYADDRINGSADGTRIAPSPGFVKDIEKMAGDTNTFISDAQAVSDTIQIDQAFNQNTAMLNAIMNPVDVNTSRAQIAEKLYEETGARGNMNADEMTQALDSVSTKFQVAPHIAAALIRDGISRRGLANIFRYTGGQRYVDMNEISKTFNKFFKTDGSVDEGKLNDAVARQAQARSAQNAKDLLANFQGQVRAAEREYYSIVDRFGANSSQAQEARARYDAIKARAQQQVKTINASAINFANTNSRLNR